MGVSISLHVLADSIGADDWAACYDASLRLLRSHPSQLMRLGSERVGRVERPVYTRQLEEHREDPERRCWHVTGDISSLHRAESFRVPRQLHPQPSVGQTGPHDDVVVALAHDFLGDFDGRDTQDVFGSKTQGEPYHFPVLAVGMLFEHCFPGAALVIGDIDRAQCESVLPWAESVLGHSVSLPVVVQPERLYERLVGHFDGAELVEALMCLNRQPQQEALRSVAEVGEVDALDAWFRRELLYYEMPDQPGAVQLFVEWLSVRRDLRQLLRFACLYEQGPGFEPEEVLGILASHGLLGAERSELVEQLTPAPGEADTPMAMFARFLFGASVGSERLEEPLEPEEVIAILDELFPEQVEALQALLHDKHESAREMQKDSNRTVRDFVSQYEENPPVPLFDDLLALESLDDLSSERAWMLRTVALSLSALIQSVEEEVKGKDTAGVREAIASVSDRQGIALSEDAWEEIDAIEELDELRFVLLVMSLSGWEQRLSWIRRATLENAALRREIYRYATDPDLLQETREWLEANSPEAPEDGSSE